MSLTKSQIFHRTESLSGEIKAAREALSECRKDAEAKQHIADVAKQAVERADARVVELEAERADLADQAREAILAVGEPLALEDGPKPYMTPPAVNFNFSPGSSFTGPADFQAQAMQNGMDRISEALEAARP